MKLNLKEEVLSLAVLRGYHLNSKELKARSTYCVINIMGEEKEKCIKTKTVKKNPNPVWNEVIERRGLKKDDILKHPQPILIEVYDEGHLRKDKLIGRAVITAEQIVLFEKNLLNLFLEPVKEKKREKKGKKGYIVVELAYNDPNMLTESTLDLIMQDFPIERELLIQLYNIFIEKMNEDDHSLRFYILSFLVKQPEFQRLIVSVWDPSLSGIFHQHPVPEEALIIWWNDLDAMYFRSKKIKFVDLIQFFSCLQDPSKRSEVLIRCIYGKEETIIKDNLRKFCTYPFYVAAENIEYYSIVDLKKWIVRKMMHQFKKVLGFRHLHEVPKERYLGFLMSPLETERFAGEVMKALEVDVLKRLAIEASQLADDDEEEILLLEEDIAHHEKEEEDKKKLPQPTIPPHDKPKLKNLRVIRLSHQPHLSATPTPSHKKSNRKSHKAHASEGGHDKIEEKGNDVDVVPVTKENKHHLFHFHRSQKSHSTSHRHSQDHSQGDRVGSTIGGDGIH